MTKSIGPGIYCFSTFVSICGELSRAASSQGATGPLGSIWQLLLHHQVVEDVRGIMPRVFLVLLK